MTAEITKESGSLYKITFDEHSEVEIGDASTAKLYPQVTLKKWGDECWIRLKPRIVYSKNIPSELGTATIDKLEIASDDGKEETHIYPLEAGDRQEIGGLELEAVLTEKPASGPFVYQWGFEDSGNLSYVCQDLSVAPLYRDAVTQDELGMYDKDGKKILSCEPWGVRSWRIKRTDTPALMSSADGEKYKTGQLGIFKRPKLIDANGVEAWGELNIDTESGLVTVTGSQDFTDKAKLPVKIDPTFGYTSVGVFSGTVNDSIFGSYDGPASPGRGIVRSLHMYITGWSSGEKVKATLYNGSLNAFKEPSTEERTSGGSGWQQFDFDGPDPALQLLNYTVAFWSDSNVTYYNSVGVGTNAKYQNSVTYGKWPRNPSLSTDTYEYSTYATFQTSTISKVRNVDYAYSYLFPGAKNIDVDGAGFGSSQGTGWVKIGDADTYSGSSTFDDMTVNSWSDTQIDITLPVTFTNTLGPLWLYVKPNGGSAQTYGFPINIQNVWGTRYADYLSSNVNYTRGMGGTSPDVDGMTLQTVKVYVGGSHSSQIRVAVYQGGTLSSPTGATLVEDLGLTSGSGTEQWLTLTSSTNPSLTKNAVTWIMVKGNDSGFAVTYSAYNGGTDFQTARGRYASTGISTNESTAYPSTFPSGGSFNSYWYSMFLEYDVATEEALAGSIDAESTITGALSISRVLSGQIDGQSAITGDLTADVPIAGQIDGQSAITGTLLRTRPAAGQIDGQAAITGFLSSTVPLNGQIAGQSGVSGFLSADVPIAGQIDGQSAISGFLSSTVPLNGQIDAQSAITGFLSSTVPIAGQIDAQSAVSGFLSAAVDLSGQIDGQSAITGFLSSTVPLNGQIDGQSAVAGNLILDLAAIRGQIDAQSQVNGFLTMNKLIAGQIDGQSTVAGDITVAASLIGSVDAQSTITGNLTGSVPLAGQIDGQSTVAGFLSSTVPLNGQIDGQSTIAGALTALRLLAGQIDAQSVVSGSLTVTKTLIGSVDAQSTITGNLTGSVPLAGQIDAQSAISGNLGVPRALAGQIDGQSTITGALIIEAVFLAGQIDAQSAITGALSGSVPLAGQIDGQSGVSGFLSSTVPLNGQIDGQSTITGLLALPVPLAGQIDGQSAIAGDITIAAGLAGQIDGQSTITGALSGTVPLSGQIDGQSTITGALGGAVVPLAGAINAVSTITALLGVTVPADTTVALLVMRRRDRVLEMERFDKALQLKRGRND